MNKLVKAITALGLSIGILSSSAGISVMLNGGLPNDLEESIKITQNNIDLDIDDNYYKSKYNFLKEYEINIDTSRPVKIAVSNQFTYKELIIIQNILDDINLIFNKINSKIQFELDSATGSNYKDSIYNTDTNTICVYKNYMMPIILGQAYNKYNAIELNINYEINSKSNPISCAFIHEIMHKIGFDDAYKKDYNDKSVMQKSGNVLNSNFLSYNDIKMIGAMFGNFENKEDKTEFMKFAKEYSELKSNEYSLNNQNNNLDEINNT